MDATITRLSNIDYYREYDRKRFQEPERKKKSADSVLRDRKKHPDRYKARYTVHNAIRDKKLIKPKECEICGKVAALTAHHVDYSDPLLVVWLCWACHGQIQ